MRAAIVFDIDADLEVVKLILGELEVSLQVISCTYDITPTDIRSSVIAKLIS